MKETMTDPTGTYTVELDGKFSLSNKRRIASVAKPASRYFFPKTVEHIQAVINN